MKTYIIVLLYYIVVYNYNIVICIIFVGYKIVLCIVLYDVQNCKCCFMVGGKGENGSEGYGL